MRSAVPRRRNPKKIHLSPLVYSVFKTIMRISACVAPWRAFSSCMTMVTRISSCFKLPTHSSSCMRFILIFFCSLTHLRRPGDYLKPGEDELEGLKRRLDERLAPPSDSRQFNASHGIDNDWEIGDCLAQWWRPNFETFMVRRVLPDSRRLSSNALPPSRARSIHLCLHTLPNLKNARSCSSCRCQSAVCPCPCPVFRITGHTHMISYAAEVLAVPKNMKLLAIPLFELYDNAAR
jgi:hypothetical protein